MLFLQLRQARCSPCSKSCRKTEQGNHPVFLHGHETYSVFILCLQLFIFQLAGRNDLIQWSPRSIREWCLVYAQTHSHMTYMLVRSNEMLSSECNPLNVSERRSTRIFYCHPACLSFHFENKLIPQTSSSDLQVVQFCLLFRLLWILIITPHALQRHHGTIRVLVVISILCKSKK